MSSSEQRMKEEGYGQVEGHVSVDTIVSDSDTT